MKNIELQSEIEAKQESYRNLEKRLLSAHEELRKHKET